MNYPILAYPAERNIYNKTIGSLRVDNIASIVQEEFGFVVKKYPVESNGIDMSFHDNNGEMLAALEVTNWRMFGFFNIDRRRRIIANLTQYPCTRLLIVSFIDNITESPSTFSEDLEANHIRVIELGFQTQPKEYFEWFHRYNPLVFEDCKTPNDPDVRSTIKTKFRFLTEEK